MNEFIALSSDWLIALSALATGLLLFRLAWERKINGYLGRPFLYTLSLFLAAVGIAFIRRAIRDTELPWTTGRAIGELVTALLIAVPMVLLTFHRSE